MLNVFHRNCLLAGLAVTASVGLAACGGGAGSGRSALRLYQCVGSEASSRTILWGLMPLSLDRAGNLQA